MAKLYFKYGAMGSSKSAQALITKFNYEERNMKVWLIKPQTDTRNIGQVVSRIGLSATADIIPSCQSIADSFAKIKCNVIIADEAQFFTPKQIDELREIVNLYDIPVLCFGLRTDFLTHLFPGSQRLMEVADSISEIKTICSCGKKAIVNARINQDGYVVTKGEQVYIGGNDSYVALCHRCWQNAIKHHIKVKE